MLRSKATAALLKLKEIDRKYKIRSSEDAKLESSLSEISAVDSKDEISKHLTGSGDKPDGIINIRPKLDIRMPDTHMERSTTVQKNGTELVTIFNKAKKRSPRSESHDFEKIQTSEEVTEEPVFGRQTVVRENAYAEKLEITSFGNSPLVISGEQVVDSETSISEDVPEVLSSSHPVSNNLEPNLSREITLKSVDSIIDGEKSVQSDLDEDLSTLVTSGTYSDDFVKTLSSENARTSRNVMVDETAVINPELTSSEVNYVSSTPPSYYQRQRSSELAKHTEPETEDIEELISAKVLRVDANLDASLLNQVKKTERSVDEEVVSPGRLLTQRSSQSSSARSSKEHRRRRRSNTSSTYRDSKSPEFPSSYRQKTEPESTNTSGSSNPSKSNHQSGKSPSETNRGGKEKDPKNPATVSPRKVQEGEREVNGVPWSSKDEAVAFITREKAATQLKKVKNLKSGTRAKDSSIKKRPPNYSKDSKMQKFASVIQPVPVTMVGPVSNFLKVSKDDEVASRSQAISRGKNRRSNKQKTDDSPRSRHRTKGVSLGNCKNQSKEEPGLGYEARDVYRLRQQIKELRLQQERDQLRFRVRGYVQQMMNDQRRFSARDGGFGGSIDQFDYNATGLRRADSLRSLFKPLDLPNVAAFKRPDFEENNAAADLDNERYLNLPMMRERVLGIRYWLKQQFVLYRDYSSLVSTINAKYIPVTLKETKKMINDMQWFYNNRERRRGHVR